MISTLFLLLSPQLLLAINGQSTCQLTDPDILGPYYLPGAPESYEELCSNSPKDDRLVLKGQIVDYDSECKRPIPFVTLDLWQANADGIYSGGKHKNDWSCRGIFRTDADGKFLIKTLMPGRYNDDGYRPAHIHFNISADGYSKLITQLYFYHDYYLAPRDSCSNCHSDARSLKVFLTHQHDIKTFEGNWKIVLSKKQRIPFPPLNRKTMRRGSYIEIQQHIMDDHM